MLCDQLLDRGISDPQVLRAMARVPREAFVPQSLQEEAYADRALPIECGQTISQPYIVGLMTQALELSGTQRVLEVGTGSGYQTAVLAELAQAVFTIERQADLSAAAQRRLLGLGYTNIAFRIGDGSLGWPEEAPFDRILVAAAAPQCPQSLVDQLADGGVLVMPVGDEEGQVLRQFRRSGQQVESAALTNCRFVPLIGAEAWPP